MDQYRCPTGIEGRKVAASMNIHHSDLTDWGLNTVEIDPDFTILDVGCGGGKTITKLANIAFKGRVSILEGSIDKSGFPDNYFDLVTAIETYYFWPSLPNAFQEIKRILKPQSHILIINEMIKNRTYENENEEILKKTHVKLVSLAEFQKTLQTAGFKKVQPLLKSGTPWNAILAQKP